ncbi:MAG TPA: hypothetical protein VNU95_09940 [Candidatus Acidoferrales bacterium]|jgi:hypothetical protein|nr:hypothetical protein [Candidatus Acidoferrales bacterium]
MTDFLKKHRPELAEEKEGSSPFLREFFMVQCPGFRGMAYRNGDGKWRGAFDHRELPDNVSVLG